ncbi:MarR family winged helix-turn-helix transcriptional regulator [Ornithinimicrobium cavernae]|uniref:MarR family winged helix-turn-helix transcriptional regulator n=1 Tax=Ornithinimicrobium cavernae TaxID=2666047 RepID=UPI000D68B444|nr:MarR family transcriptional regulator [Ornithinimicrobium cavernae]
MPTLSEAHLLSARLFQVTEQMRSDFAAVAAEFGLTALQARSLLFLDRARPMRAVADHLSCEPSNLTGVADRLERSGLVERVAGQDRRVKLLQLTPDGADLRARLAERVANRSTVTAKLDAAERRTLSTLLDRLLEPGP